MASHLILGAVFDRNPKPDPVEVKKTLQAALSHQRFMSLLGDAGYESERFHCLVEGPTICHKLNVVLLVCRGVLMAIITTPLFYELIHPLNGEFITPFPYLRMTIAESQHTFIPMVDRHGPPPTPIITTRNFRGGHDEMVTRIPVAGF